MLQQCFVIRAYARLLDSEYCLTAYLHFFFIAVIFAFTNLVLVPISFANNLVFNAATY